jgi:uncharacterized protein
MSDPIFGISISRQTNEPRPAVVADMSVVGLVGTAPNADPLVYPLNQPVLIFSDDAEKLTALGATGTLPYSVQGVNDQLGEFQVAAKIVIVRVADDAFRNVVITNIVGSSASKTGIWALPEAGPILGVIPRLIACPDYTQDQASGVSAIAMTVLGSGYVSAPTVAFSGGGGTGAAGTAVLTNGVTLAVTTPGTGYTVAPTLSISAPPPGGVQATATVTVNAGALQTITVTNPGTGYLTAPTVTITGAGTGGVITATLTGRVGSVTITNAGTGYTSAPTIAFSGGSGTGAAATATFDFLANPIVAALPPVLSQLLGVAVCTGPATTLAGFTNWRETINSDRIIPVETGVLVGPSATLRDSAPFILGIAVRRDHEKQGRPFHSWANQPIYGIVGPNRNIRFSLTDGATEGQQILALNGGVILRGEAGVETAIASGGFIFVGTDNAGTDPLWQFYNVVRGRDYIHLTFLKTLRSYLGTSNLTVAAIDAVRNTMTFALRDIKADGDILGYKVDFTRDQNSPEQLRLGKFTIDFAAEEAPVLRYLGIRSSRYRPALDALLDDLLAQVDVAA